MQRLADDGLVRSAGRRRWGEVFVVLALVSLICLGAVATPGGSRGSGRPPTAAQLPAAAAIDHFKCYESDPQTRFRQREVTLRDEFDEERPTLLAPDWLCNPVKKNRKPQLQRRVHLNCYPLKEDRQFQPHAVRVSDQFLPEQPVTVLRPERLCVPSFKEPFHGGISARRIDDMSRRRLRRILPPRLFRLPMRRLKRAITPDRPRGDPDRRLDHYKCYALEPRSVRKTVPLRDQFENELTPVVELLSLCNPVDKNGEGINDQQSRLTCYRIRDARPRFARLDVRVWNQFGVEDLTVVRPLRLCLPARKLAEPPDGQPPPPDGPPPSPPSDPRCRGDDGRTIVGTDGPDVIVGTNGTDYIDGLGGDDQIDGLAGKDVLCGGAGNDRIIGGPESTPLPDGDQIFGGSGDDMISAGAGLEATQEGPPPALDDVIEGDEGNDQIDAGAGSDVAAGEDGADVLDGRDGADSLAGGLGNDILYAGSGGGALQGGDGNDSLYGGSGRDLLSGADGDDFLEARDGVFGNDTLGGGTGFDTCFADFVPEPPGDEDPPPSDVIGGCEDGS